MKVLAVSLTLLCCFISLVLAAETSTKKWAETSDNKEKRGTASAVTSYATAKPATVTNADVAYATAKIVPSVPKVPYGQQTHLQYITQPQHLLRYTQVPQHQAQQQQHQFYYEQQQPVASAVKYSAAPAKVAYTAAQPNPNHIQYSLASDVSSFSYSSPLVEYNNLGLLTQHIGKVPVAAPHHQQQHQQQQQVAYHQAIPVATNTKQQQVAYQQHVPQQQVTYQAVAQPAAAKVATAYVVAQPHYHHGGGQIQQVEYTAAPGAREQQQHAHYAHTQIPQQYSTSATTRTHQPDYVAEPQYIAIPAHHAQQQFYYAQQQQHAAPQAQQYTREQYAQALQAHAQAHAQPHVQYQQVQEPAQYSREYTVSTAGGAGGQHSAPHAAFSIAPEYYREPGQYQYQQGKYGGQNVGIQYA